jgi:hypothetical protein
VSLHLVPAGETHTMSSDCPCGPTQVTISTIEQPGIWHQSTAAEPGVDEDSGSGQAGGPIPPHAVATAEHPGSLPRSGCLSAAGAQP